MYIYTARLNVGGARARHGGGRLSLLKLNWREAQPWKRSLDETKLRNPPQAAYKTHACVRAYTYMCACPAISYRCNEDRFLVTQSARERERERERGRGMRREGKKVATNHLPASVHKLSCVEMRERERVSSSSAEDTIFFDQQLFSFFAIAIAVYITSIMYRIRRSSRFYWNLYWDKERKKRK